VRALAESGAITPSDAQLAVAGALLAAHPGVLLHTHLAENTREIAEVAARFTLDAMQILEYPQSLP
jgi:guanine deaminase